MPKLKPDTQRARRENILDAAEVCFARSGFHASTMQDICKEAGISPGALYIYFPSKEALIAGITERNRAEFQERFSTLAEAPDFMEALRALGEQYFVDEPAHKRLMCVEIGAESTRSPHVGELFRAVDTYIHGCFEQLFERLKAEGRIKPELDIPTLAKVFCTIGDGMIWRRAIDPNYDTKALMPAILKVVSGMLHPVEQAADATKSNEAAE